MHQHVTASGRLGRKPELRYMPNGVAVCEFSLAVTDRLPDNAGDWQEELVWFRVVLVGRAAEVADRFLSKGSEIVVDGAVRASAWSNHRGEPKASLELCARSFRFLSSASARPSQPEKRQPKTAGRAHKSPGAPVASSLEMPF